MVKRNVNELRGYDAKCYSNDTTVMPPNYLGAMEMNWKGFFRGMLQVVGCITIIGGVCGVFFHMFSTVITKMLEQHTVLLATLLQMQQIMIDHVNKSCM